MRFVKVYLQSHWQSRFFEDYAMKILIIEDEEIQRIALQDDLVEAGYETMAVASPQAALDLVKIKLFDVVLTDLKMPGMDGITLLDRIKRVQPNVTAIVITAYGTVDSAVQAMNSGSFDYLTKPFSKDELLLLMRRVEKFRHVLLENLRLKKELEARDPLGKLDNHDLNHQN